MTFDPTVLTVLATKPAGAVARVLRESGVSVEGLVDDEGDVDRYVLSGRLAVDRRTGAALVRGIKDKTLFTSAIYLREHFALPVLIVEGRVDYEHTQVSGQAVRGAVLSMVLQYGLTVLSTGDVAETAAMLLMMARQEQVGIPEISLVPKRKAVDLPDLQRRIVEMLPGCGRVVARELLRHFGSVRAIVAATPEELRQVRGVGASGAVEIRTALHAEYEALDTERDLEDAIECEPTLLFGDTGAVLLGRQHFLYAESGERHIVDMVFVLPGERSVVLVELKRGRLARDHVEQLRRYLAHAGRCDLVRAYIADGWSVRGVLASVEPGELDVTDQAIAVTHVDGAGAARVLRRRREERNRRAEPRSGPAAEGAGRTSQSSPGP